MLSSPDPSSFLLFRGFEVEKLDLVTGTGRRQVGADAAGRAEVDLYRFDILHRTLFFRGCSQRMADS